MEDEEDEDLKHEATIITYVVMVLIVLGTLILYAKGLRWLFNLHSDVGLIAAVLLAVTGWLPGYWVYYKVLRPILKDMNL